VHVFIVRLYIHSHLSKVFGNVKKISMVANDLKLDSGVGVWGKDGQSVPVGVGQPSLKIDELTVR
jgi:TldD protein